MKKRNAVQHLNTIHEIATTIGDNY